VPAWPRPCRVNGGQQVKPPRPRRCAAVLAAAAVLHTPHADGLGRSVGRAVHDGVQIHSCALTDRGKNRASCAAEALCPRAPGQCHHPCGDAASADGGASFCCLSGLLLLYQEIGDATFGLLPEQARPNFGR
jgi:hypothetical protein